MTTENRKGRELGAATLEIRAMFDKHGDISYGDAIQHIKEMSKAVRDYYMENTDDKKQGSNRFNVAKNAWKKLHGKTVKARKAHKVTAKTSKVKVARRPVVASNGNAMEEVVSRGGLSKVKAEIAHLQSLVNTVETLMSKVA